jgi:predicted outer membrane repeat protein
VANLAVNFITNSITYYVATDGVDVGRTGLSPDQAFKTITNALARCRDAASDVVQIGAGTFGQTNIAVSKVVVIRGMGANDTILQGGSDTNTTVSRFFTTSGGNNRPIVIRDMTMRFGGGRGSTGDNKGGAMHGAAQSPLYIFNCSFVSNTAANGGGAIYLHDDRGYYGQLFVSNCLFRANRTTSGTSQGGAIYNEHWGRVQLDASTFLANEAGENGGAVFCSVLMWAQNVTFWGNVAKGSRGGAIAKGGSDTYLVNCTIVSNAANPSTGYGGAYRQEAGTVRFLSTVIASNAAPNSSAFYAQGGSIYVTNSVVYGTRSTPAGQGNSTLANTGDAGVLPPADNGGSMPTCAIVENSICRNYAGNTTALSFDQRGYTRDSQPDIGAFEYGAHDSLARGTVLILY